MTGCNKIPYVTRSLGTIKVLVSIPDPCNSSGVISHLPYLCREILFIALEIMEVSDE